MKPYEKLTVLLIFYFIRGHEAQRLGTTGLIFNSKLHFTRL